MDAGALARRVGLRNIAFLLAMLVLAALAAAGRPGVPLVGGVTALVFLLVNLATLARAMGNRLPVLPSAIGVGLALLCGSGVMQVAMIRAGI